jgi:hypothetical protein
MDPTSSSITWSFFEKMRRKVKVNRLSSSASPVFT